MHIRLQRPSPRPAREAADVARALRGPRPSRSRPTPTRRCRALLPVTLSVFAQMIGEGIAIATLPLHLTRLGAKPVEVALATSFFSVAQMVCCPLLVRRSGGAGGRGQTLCLCLAGATLGNVGIAMSPSVAAIVVCRFLCGAFAASVPVAQAAATELVAPAQAPAALARVAASSQMAVVVGPSCAALLMSAFAAAGVPQAFRLRAVFLTASVFAAGVLGVLARSFQATAAKAQAIASQDEPALKVEQKQVAPTKPAPGILPGVSAQFALRSIALVGLVADAVGLLLRIICAQVHGV